MVGQVYSKISTALEQKSIQLRAVRDLYIRQEIQIFALFNHATVKCRPGIWD
jgi:hypothetical protein